MPMTTAERLERKRQDEKKRQDRIRAAQKRLDALAAGDRERVTARASELRMIETETRKPRAHVAYLEDALAEVLPKKAAKPKATKARPALKATVTIEAAGSTRTCPRCQQDRPVTDFKPYRSDCRECYNARWREWDAARKAKKAKAS